MPKPEEAPFAAYLHTVLAQLSMLTPADRSMIQAELEAHLVDAARDHGRPHDDPAFQAAVIAELGPAKRLGKAWAQAYRPLEGRMAGSTKVLFWILWILASTVGRAYGSHDLGFEWYFPVATMGIIVLQSLLLHWVAGVRWWRHWLTVSLIPWLVLLGLWVNVPWATLTEGQGELTLIYSLLLTAIVSGVMQWLVLRRHVKLAGLWIVVPLISLVAAFMISNSVNINLVVYDVRTNEITRIRGWKEVHMLIGMISGAIHGIVTGSALVGLMSLRAGGHSQRIA